MTGVNLVKYNAIYEKCYAKKMGKVSKIVGLTIESIGPEANLNDLCRIVAKDNPQMEVMAEVVGFKDNRILLMPFESVDGIGPGSIVENTGSVLKVAVSDDILGKTLDGLGRPISGEELVGSAEYPVECTPPDPMSREIISEVLPLGVKAVDGLITVG